MKISIKIFWSFLWFLIFSVLELCDRFYLFYTFTVYFSEVKLFIYNKFLKNCSYLGEGFLLAYFSFFGVIWGIISILSIFFIFSGCFSIYLGIFSIMSIFLVFSIFTGYFSMKLTYISIFSSEISFFYYKGVLSIPKGGLLFFSGVV